MTGSLPRMAWAVLLALSSLIAEGMRSCVSTARADSLPLVRGVGCVGLTVSDADRSADFYGRVLGFEKVADGEQAGDSLEQLAGVFGARTRTVRLRLGRECLDATEYLAPRGRPAPSDARSNDRWSQHVAIVVSDMDRAYAALRAFRVEHASTGPQRLPDWNQNAGGIRVLLSRSRPARARGLAIPGGKTTLFTADPDRAYASLRTGHAAFVSPGVVLLSERRLGYSRALLARDPDGHVVQLAGE